MKPRRICSLILLIAMILSTLVSCGFAAPMMRADLDPSDYPSEAQAKDVAITQNLGDIRVMSFNLQNTVSSDATLKENRYLAVVGQIQDYAPTLLGLQEDGAHWNTELTAKLTNYVRLNSTIDNSNNGKGEYCSIYYDTNVLKAPTVTDTCFLTHDGSTTAYSITWEDAVELLPEIESELNMTKSTFNNGKTGAITYTKNGKEVTEQVSVLTRRLMTYGIFELNGQKFLYVNTHLTHRSQGNDYAERYESFLELRQLARMAEWDILHANVGKLLEEHGKMPVIITGDLNEVPGSPSYNHYATHYNDASKLAKILKGPDGTWNAAWSSSTNGQFSTSSEKDNQASSTLDYCFITPDAFTVEQFQVAANRRQITNSKDETGYVAVSDHLAIITDLSFEKDSDAPTVTLQKPGAETSKISYYTGNKDTSWFDSTNVQEEYVLDTADKLAGFIAVKQQYRTTIDFSGVTIKLSANMVFNQLKDGVTEFTSPEDWKTDYTNSNWKWQEQDSKYPFQGIFDGQGHYISGIYFAPTGDKRGLFGPIGNATMKNFSVVDSYMVSSNTSAKNHYGTIATWVAEEKTANFYNIYSECVLVKGTEKAVTCNGGFVGSVQANATVSFDYCTYAGAVNMPDCIKAGGFVGSVYSGVTVTFRNCANYGDVTAQQYAGGFVGVFGTNVNAIFENCYNSGDVTGGTETGGIIGTVSSAQSLQLFECANAGKINGGKYTGGLIGYAKVAALYVNDSANIGDITAGRCSGGLIGTIDGCDDLIIADCAVMANLDFSQIGAGGTAETPVSVPAGCQVGGLIGRTYDVDGFVSGISLSGSMKGAANIVTELDVCKYYVYNADGSIAKENVYQTDENGDFVLDENENKIVIDQRDKLNTSYKGDYNLLASGAITGFNSCYAKDDTVMDGTTDSRVFSHIHYDTILVSMDMTDVGSYLGGTRDTPINSTYSKISHRNVIYDEEKYAASGAPALWGARIDKDRRIDSSGETTYGQFGTPIAYSTAGLCSGKDLGNKTDGNGNAINYYTWKAKFTTWQKVNGGVLVPTVDLSSAIHAAMKTDDLFVLSYQTKANAEDADLTDFRFVSVMKDTGLPAVGYHVTMSYINGEGERASITETVYCSTVYTSIKGGSETYEASTYGGDYIFTLVIGGVPVKTAEDIIVTLQPFAAEQDGEEILFTDYRAMTYALN